MRSITKWFVLGKAATAERDRGPAREVKISSLGISDNEISRDLQRSVSIHDDDCRFVHFLHLSTILIPEASVARNDDHARLGHAEPATVFFQVVADLNCGRDVNVFVDDDASQSGM